MGGVVPQPSTVEPAARASAGKPVRRPHATPSPSGGGCIGFYTYNALITAAARSFNGFGTTGDADTRKRELAAFFAQTSLETTDTSGSGEQRPKSFAKFLEECGIGQAGRIIKADLVNNPDMATTDPVISFKATIWFWMTPQANKPSSHSVITGRWTPSDAVDSSTNRVLGYDVITNIIGDGLECERGADDRVASRIGFYRRYCDILGVSHGNNLDCCIMNKSIMLSIIIRV
ncbi:hypothetical protein JRO89_XS08G0113700 [Xanthoceras sorbifolium]|uniref:chitinase n=1 Tax=Xanthoceras sorbifolium TaxID=99658 RepID=A0ABQ8HPA5_9ROSI|nr:hypothetical protein JRO89_XS08G0113700 [Xanthoceras sorbifolium]